MSYACFFCVPLKMRWLLKSSLNLWLIKIQFWSHGDFKSHIIFRGTWVWRLELLHFNLYVYDICDGNWSSVAFSTSICYTLKKKWRLMILVVYLLNYLPKGEKKEVRNEKTPSLSIISFHFTRSTQLITFLIFN
jgi:hypothetical protein